MLSNGFLAQLRQYAALEAQMNRDFSEPILQLSNLEYERLVSVGVEPEVAAELLNAALTNEVKRFPIQLP